MICKLSCLQDEVYFNEDLSSTGPALKWKAQGQVQIPKPYLKSQILKGKGDFGLTIYTQAKSKSQNLNQTSLTLSKAWVCMMIQQRCLWLQCWHCWRLCDVITADPEPVPASQSRTSAQPSVKLDTLIIILF